MRIGVVSVFLVCATVFAASPAQAQLCSGAPSFREQPYQVGVNTAFTKGAQGVGGHFAAGMDMLFAGGGVNIVNYSDLDATATEVIGFVGADFATTETERVFVCPVGQIGFGVGPDIGSVDVSSFNLAGGGNIGIIASESDNLMVVPTFGVAVIYKSVTAKLPSGDDTQSDGFGQASVGVGFVLNRNISITPSIAVPFSADNSDPIFNIRFAFNFGN